MPQPDKLYPLSHINNDAIFLKNFITNPHIIVGDYTYYHHVGSPETFQKENVLYNLDKKLIIGKFCSIAQGTTFLMGYANHAMDGFSTYPFSIFRGEWTNEDFQWPIKGDTIVGNDVWFGYSSRIMPGVKIGDGAIIAACSVVTRDVPPYTIVGGNPAKIIRHRFPDEIVKQLLEIQWWNWDRAKITRNLSAITGADIEKLKNAM